MARPYRGSHFTADFLAPTLCQISNAILNWHVEKTKEEVENEELFMLSTTVLFLDCEVGHYYRARGLHGVELYDELEACATETNGVRVTNLWN